MEERSKLQKAVLISVAAMAVAFAILTFVFHRLEGVKFEEGFLRVSAQADDPAATVYAGKVQGERVKITVTDCPDEQRTEVVVQVGDRVRDECAVETGLPPIQADQLGPVEHIRITKNDSLLFEGGYDPEYGMGWYDLDGNWDPFTMSVSYSSTAGDDYWEHYETDRGTILSFARGLFPGNDRHGGLLRQRRGHGADLLPLPSDPLRLDRRGGGTGLPELQTAGGHDHPPDAGELDLGIPGAGLGAAGPDPHLAV